MLVEPLQASTMFYHGFTLPRRRSTGFGLNPCDLTHFHTSPLINCGYLLSLRIPLIELSLPQRRTPRLVIQNERYTPLSAYHTITIKFQTLLTPCYGFFSAFPHGTIRYRSQDVFTVGGNCPPNSHTISNVRYSGYLQKLFFILLRGFHPLRRHFPVDFTSEN